jgi:hypothetical protein
MALPIAAAVAAGKAAVAVAGRVAAAVGRTAARAALRKMERMRAKRVPKPKISPREILSLPRGMTLILLAGTIEALDWLPIPLILDQILELPLEIIFIILFIMILKPSFKSLILPFGIERIPGLSDILPTWLLKMFF